MAAATTTRRAAMKKGYSGSGMRLRIGCDGRLDPLHDAVAAEETVKNGREEDQYHQRADDAENAAVHGHLLHELRDSQRQGQQPRVQVVDGF